MKNAYNSVLLLTLVGIVILIAGSFYFGAPLFGWTILIAIFIVFIVEQFFVLKKIKIVAEEDSIIEKCERNNSFIVNGNGIVAKRIELAKNLINKGLRLDSSIAFDVLSANSNVSIPRSSGGTVILLGLMGTFFGLMSSVATAGSVMDNSSTQGTLDTIQLLFLNMKGIFGTSLCGLFSALLLNASRNVLIEKRDDFMAKLDSFTLKMQQGESNSNENNKNELERLFDVVSRNLNAVVNSVQESLVGVVDKVGKELSLTTANLSDSISNVVNEMNKSVIGISESVSSSLLGAITPVESSVKELSQSVESVALGLKNGLEQVAETTHKTMLSTSESIVKTVEHQVECSNEQWNTFMLHLKEEEKLNMDSQREGIENLKSIAVQISEKVQFSSVELSQSVSDKLSNLSNDILSAFQNLSDTSSVLLNAQKSLTDSIENRIVKEKDVTDALGNNILETAELMRVNQSELSANLEMLRSSLETILEKLSGDTQEHEEENNFIEQLNQSLEAFHERACEVLMENAVKTQEILLEVLEQTQRAQISNSKPKVEG